MSSEVSGIDIQPTPTPAPTEAAQAAQQEEQNIYDMAAEEQAQQQADEAAQQKADEEAAKALEEERRRAEEEARKEEERRAEEARKKAEAEAAQKAQQQQAKELAQQEALNGVQTQNAKSEIDEVLDEVDDPRMAAVYKELSDRFGDMSKKTLDVFEQFLNNQDKEIDVSELSGEELSDLLSSFQYLKMNSLGEDWVSDVSYQGDSEAVVESMVEKLTQSFKDGEINENDLKIALASINFTMDKSDYSLSSDELKDLVREKIGDDTDFDFEKFDKKLDTQYKVYNTKEQDHAEKLKKEEAIRNVETIDDALQLLKDATTADDENNVYLINTQKDLDKMSDEAKEALLDVIKSGNGDALKNYIDKLDLNELYSINNILGRYSELGYPISGYTDKELLIKIADSVLACDDKGQYIAGYTYLVNASSNRQKTKNDEKTASSEAIKQKVDKLAEKVEKECGKLSEKSLDFIKSYLSDPKIEVDISKLNGEELVSILKAFEVLKTDDPLNWTGGVTYKGDSETVIESMVEKLTQSYKDGKIHEIDFINALGSISFTMDKSDHSLSSEELKDLVREKIGDDTDFDFDKLDKQIDGKLRRFANKEKDYNKVIEKRDKLQNVSGIDDVLDLFRFGAGVDDEHNGDLQNAQRNLDKMSDEAKNALVDIIKSGDLNNIKQYVDKLSGTDLQGIINILGVLSGDGFVYPISKCTDSELAKKLVDTLKDIDNNGDYLAVYMHILDIADSETVITENDGEDDSLDLVGYMDKKAQETGKEDFNNTAKHTAQTAAAENGSYRASHFNNSNRNYTVSTYTYSPNSAYQATKALAKIINATKEANLSSTVKSTSKTNYSSTKSGAASGKGIKSVSGVRSLINKTVNGAKKLISNLSAKKIQTSNNAVNMSAIVVNSNKNVISSSDLNIESQSLESLNNSKNLIENNLENVEGILQSVEDDTISVLQDALSDYQDSVDEYMDAMDFEDSEICKEMKSQTELIDDNISLKEKEIESCNEQIRSTKDAISQQTDLINNLDGIISSYSYTISGLKRDLRGIENSETKATIKAQIKQYEELQAEAERQRVKALKEKSELSGQLLVLSHQKSQCAIEIAQFTNQKVDIMLQMNSSKSQMIQNAREKMMISKAAYENTKTKMSQQLQSQISSAKIQLTNIQSSLNDFEDTLPVDIQVDNSSNASKNTSSATGPRGFETEKEQSQKITYQNTMQSIANVASFYNPDITFNNDNKQEDGYSSLYQVMSEGNDKLASDLSRNKSNAAGLQENINSTNSKIFSLQDTISGIGARLSGINEEFNALSKEKAILQSGYSSDMDKNQVLEIKKHQEEIERKMEELVVEQERLQNIEKTEERKLAHENNIKDLYEKEYFSSSQGYEQTYIEAMKIAQRLQEDDEEES